MTTGSTTWGHDTGVTETNVRDFSGNWTGTGTITGSGDNEAIELGVGEYMESEVVNTGIKTVELLQNYYGTGDAVILRYRTGDSEVNCQAASWQVYTNSFLSDGYVQIRVDATSLLAASVNKRYLTKGGIPFLIAASHPGGLPIISLTDAETYLAARAAQGFNFLQFHSIVGSLFGGNATTFETYDGIKPFTVTGDISTPNEAYFSRLDDLIDLCFSYGFIVQLTGAETQELLDTWKTNGTTKCYNYGAYLGNRYKNRPNIVWNNGTDFVDYGGSDPTIEECIRQIDLGIRSTDTGDHLHTLWLGWVPSRDWDEFFGDSPVIELDMTYQYESSEPIHVQDLHEYGLSPAMPFYFGEGYYELFPADWSWFKLRKQIYWSMTCGACGISYMNDDWGFQSGWESRLSQTGAIEFTYCLSLFTAYSWWLLVPDTGHSILTNGYESGSTLASCAWVTDGTLAIIYMPTNRTMTVDMSQFASTITARWYDPTNETFAADAASPLSNSGTHNFSHSGTNSAGDSDWVLVLEV